MGRPRRGRGYSIATPPEASSGRVDVPKIQSTPITQQRISFSMECCRHGRCYGEIADRRERIDFADKIHELSQLTWGDINQAPRKNFGYEKLECLREGYFGDAPKDVAIIGFVYHDNHRMIGYRDAQGVFHIWLFDYNGDLYGHSRSHP